MLAIVGLICIFIVIIIVIVIMIATILEVAQSMATKKYIEFEDEKIRKRTCIDISLQGVPKKNAKEILALDPFISEEDGTGYIVYPRFLHQLVVLYFAGASVNHIREYKKSIRFFRLRRLWSLSCGRAYWAIRLTLEYISIQVHSYVSKFFIY